MVWDNAIFRVGMECTNLSILIAILMYHSIHLYQMHSQRQNVVLIKLCGLDIRHLSILSIIVNLLVRIFYAIVYLPQFIILKSFLTNDLCTFIITFAMILTSISKMLTLSF